MTETRKSIGLGALALIPIVCCVGVPLIAAAGVGVAVAARVGGIAAGAVALAVVTLLGVRVRRRRSRRGSALSTVQGRP
jgi:membrane associated rhomboid family serine protease